MIEPPASTAVPTRPYPASPSSSASVVVNDDMPWYRKYWWAIALALIVGCIACMLLLGGLWWLMSQSNDGGFTPLPPESDPNSGGAPQNYDCPTLQEMRDSTGLDWTKLGSPATGENCSFVYNTANYSYDPMPLLSGWMVTTAEQDGLVHVQKGDGTTVQSKATTIRLLSANPGLTSEVQTNLTKQYAPSAGYSPDIVVCDDCSAGYQSSTPAQSYSAPSVAGFVCSPIEGGYVCKASVPTNFIVPSGWKAYAGIPAQWYPSGSDLGVQSQVSLYPSQ